MAEWYTIGQFSKKADVSARTLRVYEEMGLIRSHSRGQNGYRYFEEGQLEILERIKSFKSFGFTLKEIRALLIADIGMNSDKLVSFLNGRMVSLNELETEIKEQRQRIQNALNILNGKDQALKENEKLAIMKHFEESIPMITVRDFILFPGSYMAIFVGREFTKAAIKKSQAEYNGKIVVLSQKAFEMNEKPAVGEFFDVGTVSKIIEAKDLPDGTMKLVVHAEERCHVVDVLENAGISLARYSKLEPFSYIIPEESRIEILEQIQNHMIEGEKKLRLLMDLRNVKNGYSFLMRAAEAISVSKHTKNSTYKKTFTPGLFTVDAYSDEDNSAINMDLLRTQEILAETDGSQGAQKLLELLRQN